MKKYFVVLGLIVLFILLAAGGVKIYGQKATPSGGANIWSDSVKTGDLTRIFKLEMKYPQLQASVRDTGTFYADSLKFFAGIRRYNTGNTCIDTLWDTNPLLIKKNDEAGKFVTVTSAAGTTTTYTIVNSSIDLLKVVLSNAQSVTGRLVKFNIQGNQLNAVQNYDGTVKMGLSTTSGGGYEDTTTHAGDTVSAPITTSWKVTVIARDSAIEVSLNGLYSSTDAAVLKQDEFYTWNLNATSYPKIYYRKRSASSGAATVGVIKEGY